MRYNKKKQEVMFNPYRLALLHGRLSVDWQYSRREQYFLVKRDMIQSGRPVAIYTPAGKDNDGKPFPARWREIRVDALDAELSQRYGFYRKADAIKEAKRQSVELGIAFDPSVDVLDLITFTMGPERNCLLCSREDYGWTPYVCDECRRHALRGCSMDEGTVKVQVNHSHLVPVWFRDMPLDADELGRQIIAAIMHMGGYKNMRMYSRPDVMIRPDYDAESGDRYDSVLASHGTGDAKWFCALMRPGDAERLQAVYSLIRQALRACYLVGIERGNDFVSRIAKGELTVAELNDAQAKIERTKEYL